MRQGEGRGATFDVSFEVSDDGVTWAELLGSRRCVPEESVEVADVPAPTGWMRARVELRGGDRRPRTLWIEKGPRPDGGGTDEWTIVAPWPEPNAPPSGDAGDAGDEPRPGA